MIMFNQKVRLIKLQVHAADELLDYTDGVSTYKLSNKEV